MKHAITATILFLSLNASAQIFVYYAGDTITCMAPMAPRLKSIAGTPLNPILTDSAGNQFYLRLIPGSTYQRSEKRKNALLAYAERMGCKTPLFMDEVSQFYIAQAVWRKP